VVQRIRRVTFKLKVKQHLTSRILFRSDSLRAILGFKIRQGRPIMSGPKYSSAAIREIWEKEGRQRWDGRTHGRGLGLLIVDALVAQGTLMLGRLRPPSQTFEFWRDQNKVRGRFIGLGNGVVVARLNKDGLPE
jgi:hypothetical protein